MLFWGLLLPFWETPEIWKEILFRHLRGVYLGEVPTNRKEIGPGIEMQEEHQSTDGTDGLSKSTDPAVSPATDLRNG